MKRRRNASEKYEVILKGDPFARPNTHIIIGVENTNTLWVTDEKVTPLMSGFLRAAAAGRGPVGRAEVGLAVEDWIAGEHDEYAMVKTDDVTTDPPSGSPLKNKGFTRMYGTDNGIEGYSSLPGNKLGSVLSFVYVIEGKKTVVSFIRTKGEEKQPTKPKSIIKLALKMSMDVAMAYDVETNVVLVQNVGTLVSVLPKKELQASILQSQKELWEEWGGDGSSEFYVYSFGAGAAWNRGETLSPTTLPAFYDETAWAPNLHRDEKEGDLVDVIGAYKGAGEEAHVFLIQPFTAAHRSGLSPFSSTQANEYYPLASNALLMEQWGPNNFPSCRETTDARDSLSVELTERVLQDVKVICGKGSPHDLGSYNLIRFFSPNSSEWQIKFKGETRDHLRRALRGENPRLIKQAHRAVGRANEETFVGPTYFLNINALAEGSYAYSVWNIDKASRILDEKIREGKRASFTAREQSSALGREEFGLLQVPWVLKAIQEIENLPRFSSGKLVFVLDFSRAVEAGYPPAEIVEAIGKINSSLLAAPTSNVVIHVYGVPDGAAPLGKAGKGSTLAAFTASARKQARPAIPRSVPGSKKVIGWMGIIGGRPDEKLDADGNRTRFPNSGGHYRWQEGAPFLRYEEENTPILIRAGTCQLLGYTKQKVKAGESTPREVKRFNVRAGFTLKDSGADFVEAIEEKEKTCEIGFSPGGLDEVGDVGTFTLSGKTFYAKNLGTAEWEKFEGRESDLLERLALDPDGGFWDATKQKWKNTDGGFYLFQISPTPIEVEKEEVLAERKVFTGALKQAKALGIPGCMSQIIKFHLTGVAPAQSNWGDVIPSFPLDIPLSLNGGIRFLGEWWVKNLTESKSDLDQMLTTLYSSKGAGYLDDVLKKKKMRRLTAFALYDDGSITQVKWKADGRLQAGKKGLTTYPGTVPLGAPLIKGSKARMLNPFDPFYFDYLIALGFPTRIRAQDFPAKSEAGRKKNNLEAFSPKKKGESPRKATDRFEAKAKTLLAKAARLHAKGKPSKENKYRAIHFLLRDDTPAAKRVVNGEASKADMAELRKHYSEYNRGFPFGGPGWQRKVLEQMVKTRLGKAPRISMPAKEEGFGVYVKIFRGWRVYSKTKTSDVMQVSGPVWTDSLNKEMKSQMTDLYGKIFEAAADEESPSVVRSVLEAFQDFDVSRVSLTQRQLQDHTREETARRTSLYEKLSDERYSTEVPLKTSQDVTLSMSDFIAKDIKDSLKLGRLYFPDQNIIKMPVVTVKSKGKLEVVELKAPDAGSRGLKDLRLEGTQAWNRVNLFDVISSLLDVADQAIATGESWRSTVTSGSQKRQQYQVLNIENFGEMLAPYAATKPTAHLFVFADGNKTVKKKFKLTLAGVFILNTLITAKAEVFDAKFKLTEDAADVLQALEQGLRDKDFVGVGEFLLTLLIGADGATSHLREEADRQYQAARSSGPGIIKVRSRDGLTPEQLRKEELGWEVVIESDTPSIKSNSKRRRRRR